MSQWRTQNVVADWLRAAVKGAISMAHLSSEWTHLRRYLCDTPRKRRRRTLDALDSLSQAAKALS